MTAASEAILANAMALSREERAEIAASLLESLDGETGTDEAAAIEAAWMEEAERRSQAYERGELKSYSLEEVFPELRNRKVEP